MGVAGGNVDAVRGPTGGWNRTGNEQDGELFTGFGDANEIGFLEVEGHVFDQANLVALGDDGAAIGSAAMVMVNGLASERMPKVNANTGRMTASNAFIRGTLGRVLHFRRDFSRPVRGGVRFEKVFRGCSLVPRSTPGLCV